MPICLLKELSVAVIIPLLHTSNEEISFQCDCPIKDEDKIHSPHFMQ